MRHLSTLLLFLSCVIYVIQSSEPAPEPHPSSEPQPHAPEPHTPEPHTPEPHTPEPHTPEPHTPQPHAPEPHTPEPHTPEPVPEPQPSSEPAPGPSPTPTPTVDDFYIEELAKANYDGVFNGAIALTGNNDTISIFGGTLVNGSVPDFVLQYTISTHAFVNASYWNPTLRIVSYSQAPPDPSNNYVQNPLYYLVDDMTEYSVWSYDGTNFQKAFNVSFKMGETGQQIAASTGGVYVYDPASGLWWWDGTNVVKQNATGPEPEGRLSPAIVAFNGDLFLQGGINGTKVYDDFWYYSMGARTWSQRNSTGIPPSWGHTATLSVLKTTNYNSVNIYFTGLTSGSIVNYDINANSSSSIMGSNNLPLRSVATINGNRLFVYGGSVGVAYSNSLYQIVNEKYCTSSPDCETCVSVTGCTFCKSAVSASAPSCVSGTSTNPFILSTCQNTNSTGAVISMVEYCPEIFPSWAIALIVIGGVILVGGIVFGIMKLRSGKPGYEPV